MKYCVELGSGFMIYMPSLINIGSGIQKLIGGIHRYTERMELTLGMYAKYKILCGDHTYPPICHIVSAPELLDSNYLIRYGRLFA
jgi:hypothetical protein